MQLQTNKQTKKHQAVLSEKLRSNFSCSFSGLLIHPVVCPVLKKKINYNLRLEHSMKCSLIVVFHFKQFISRAGSRNSAGLQLLMGQMAFIMTNSFTLVFDASRRNTYKSINRRRNQHRHEGSKHTSQKVGWNIKFPVAVKPLKPRQ